MFSPYYISVYNVSAKLLTEILYDFENKKKKKKKKKKYMYIEMSLVSSFFFSSPEPKAPGKLIV